MPNGFVFRPVWVRNETILDRRVWVYYLILTDIGIRQWGELTEVRPTEELYKFITEQVSAYVHLGKRPPEAIESAIMNVADDFMAGREITLRAGDYIAVQQFMRSVRQSKG